jgi:signal transduction histidine kinase
MHAHDVQPGGLLQWFSGGSQHPYHTLVQCMSGDWFWIAATVALDLTVAAGYAMIAVHWWRQQRNLAPGRAKSALSALRNIFIFCGLCGYIFIPIKMFWPAWRLYDLFMAVLVYFTWRYALGSRGLKVLYQELGRTEQLQHDLESSRAESRRKTFFLNAVSHDLRTPLNGLMLQADLAQVSADTRDVEGLRESLTEIKASARATADLLDSFLELGRLDWSHDARSVVPFDLAESLNALVTTHLPTARSKGIELTLACPPKLVVGSDRVKLDRIVANLVGNAIKFTDRGGVRIEVSVTDATLRVDVIDTGVGIAAEHVPHLFEEFFQVRNNERDRTKGFGLGLAIAGRLADRLGGTLSVQSSPGEGSRFRLELPGAFPAAADDARAASVGAVSASPALAG